MDISRKEYYSAMVERRRGFYIIHNHKLVAVVTFLIGDNDETYLLNKEPWKMVDDDPYGSTIYIDQLITDRQTHKFILREFSKVIEKIKQNHPLVSKVKWIRVGADFRKKGITEGVTRHVYCKNLK